MKFYLDEVPIYFPFDYIYPEQYRYMLAIKRALDTGGTAVFEMPSGTGKTISLISVGMGYQEKYPERAKKIIYCSRTVVEIEKALKEAKFALDYKQKMIRNSNKNQEENNEKEEKNNNKMEIENEEKTKPLDYLCVGLSSRRTLCIHPEVGQQKEGKTIDSMCRDLTSSFVREKAKQDPSIPTCNFYQNFHSATENEEIVLKGVYTFENLQNLGKKETWCPYFLARSVINQANMIIFSYQYMLDPKISDMISKDFAESSVIFFDEAHNIDNVCCDALSIHFNNRTLDLASKNIKELNDQVAEKKQTEMNRITDEYNRLLTNLASSIPNDVTDELKGQPVLSKDQVSEVVPGNIRKSEHFLMFLLRFIAWIKSKIKVSSAITEHISSLRQSLYQEYQIEPRVLQFCSSRLSSLFWTLKITEIFDYSSLSVIADFATLLGTYSQGFLIVIEPISETNKNTILQLSCLDASLAFRPVHEKFRSVILTSGTISPLDIYPKLLKFRAVSIERFSMTVSRNNVCPLIVTRGSDQVSISSRFDVREEPAVVRNFGTLLGEVSTIIPDGIICFFPSYRYMEQIVWMWNEKDLLNNILVNKLLFIETPDSSETALALDLYRQACNSGRGAVFFCVSRGKVSEGIDFNDHYGRAVIVFGVPYLDTRNNILKARLEFMRDHLQINESDFLNFDAMRVTSQCLGRVIRSKSDYGIMILADKRFSRSDKREKLPRWIFDFLQSSYFSLSTDMATSICKEFLRELAQPLTKNFQLEKKTLWTFEDIQNDQSKFKQRKNL